jgi:hypothetical protein
MRRLMLSGGLILMGSESVGQILMAIVICAMWLCLLIHLKPYKSEWDNIVAITLAGNLLLTIVSGMAFKLYSTMSELDEYERNGFGAVLIVVSVLCIALSLGTTLASTPCFQKRVEKFEEDRRRSKSFRRSRKRQATQSIEMAPKKKEVSTTDVSIEIAVNKSKEAEKVASEGSEREFEQSDPIEENTIPSEEGTNLSDATVVTNVSDPTEVIRSETAEEGTNVSDPTEVIRSDTAEEGTNVSDIALHEEKISEATEKECFVNVFKSIAKEGTLSTDAFLTFLKALKSDTEDRIAMINDWEKEVISCDEFVSLCQKMTLKKENVEQYEKKIKVNVAIRKLRRLSTINTFIRT